MKKTVNHKRWETFSVLKRSEGGMGVDNAKFILREAGIPTRRGYSPYVGESGIMVPATKRILRKTARLLYRS